MPSVFVTTASTVCAVRQDGCAGLVALLCSTTLDGSFLEHMMGLSCLIVVACAVLSYVFDHTTRKGCQRHAAKAEGSPSHAVAPLHAGPLLSVSKQFVHAALACRPSMQAA